MPANSRTWISLPLSDDVQVPVNVSTPDVWLFPTATMHHATAMLGELPLVKSMVFVQVLPWLSVMVTGLEAAWTPFVTRTRRLPAVVFADAVTVQLVPDTLVFPAATCPT